MTSRGGVGFGDVLTAAPATRDAIAIKGDRTAPPGAWV
jgi:hypothetical protein